MVQMAMRWALAALVLSSSIAAADELEEPGPPPGFESKRPLSKDDLSRKKAGGYFTGLPLANFDPNTGYGGGARGYYFFNGEPGDALFPFTPYQHRVFLQFFATSKGAQFHWLDYDVPAILGTPLRFRSQLIYGRNTEQHFFGLGERAMDDLTFSGAGRSYDDYGDYTDALREIRADGTTLSRYNDFDLQRPIWFISVERTFFRGLVRPLLGMTISYAAIDDYTGERVDARGGTAIMGPTLLREQCDAGLVVGCEGGWDNAVRLGLSFDTRDFEPDPNSGVFVDAALDIGTKVVGSLYDYRRFLLSARYYHSVAPSLTDLVFAARLSAQAQSRGTPISSMNTIPFTEDPRSGLGGVRTLRGYRQDRFLGHYWALVNTELRWTFYRFVVFNQKLALGTVGFADTGRVWDYLGDVGLERWRHGYGAGFRVAWNQATIIMVDYGRSSEDTGLYINFNHQF